MELMAEDHKYNGWTNWETWVTNLWINEGLLDQFEMGEQARYFAETDEESATYDMAGWIREQVENIIDELWLNKTSAGIVNDFVGGCLGDVNWMEIASHWVDEAIQNEKEQTANAES
jgi:hypothetical protein